MKGKMKKLLAVVLTLTMVLSMSVVTAFADDTTAAALEGEKTSQIIDRATNNYKVQVKVPGGDGIEKHDEVILMVDGSYSTDDDWNTVVNAITEVAKAVLNGNGNTQLTLMAFGMGDNEVIVHAKDANDVAEYLGELPGTLLYGRSSTNCEAGFTGVAEYIEAHDETLNDAYVIYISDGEINTDETPRNFYANWKTWTKFGALTVAKETFAGSVAYGENLPAAFTKVFGDRFADAADADAIIERAFNGGEVTEEELYAFADQVWSDVWAYSNMDPEKEYPVSDAERAFVKYDKENGTYVQDLFYYSIYKSSYVTYPDRWTRTPAAANELAANDKVKHLYMVDSNGKTGWMELDAENSTFEVAGKIANLLPALEGIITDLATTPYNNVSVTDYMSKWVNLNPETIKVYEKDTLVAEFDAENSDVENGIYKYKWTGEAYAAADPIVLTKVDAADYEAGGEDVVGNESGDIYKVTWNIKDGALVRSDNYRLEYEVTVDTEEVGFEYDKELVANGTTTVTYTDENDDENTEDIKVPTVDVPKTELPPDQYLEDDTTDTTEETDTTIEEDGKGDLPEDQYLQDGADDTDVNSDESNDDAAQTGDDTPMGLLFGIAVAAAAAMVVIRRKSVK